MAGNDCLREYVLARAKQNGVERVCSYDDVNTRYFDNGTYARAHNTAKDPGCARFKVRQMDPILNLATPISN